MTKEKRWVDFKEDPNQKTPKERLAEIEVEMKDEKLSTSEMETLIDELLEISDSERKKLNDLTNPFKQKFPWWAVAKVAVAVVLLFTLGIHLAKLAWYFILLNWNLW